MARRDQLPSYDSPPHPVYSVIDSVGTAFALGAAGGAAFHLARGLLRGSPDAGVHAALANAPRVAGRFGAFCAVFSALEQAATYLAGAGGGESSVTGSSAAAVATFALQGMRRGGGPGAALGALLGGSCVVVAAEINRAANVEDGADCLRRNQMDGGRLDPAVLRPKPDGDHFINLVEDVSLQHK